MKKTVLLSFILVVSASNVYAGALGGLDAGEMNRQLTKDLVLHEAVTRARNRDALIKNDKIISEQQKARTRKAEQTQNTDIPKEEIEVNLEKVSFRGNSVVPLSTLNNMVADRKGKPLNNENIGAIRKTIMSYYQRHGFYSAVAIVDTTNIQNGELVIKINEGPRNSVQIEQ